MLRVDREHVPLDLPAIPRYIHQHLPGHDPQSYRPRPDRARRLHLFDGVDDAADDLFRVRSAKGGVGAVDGGLDDRVGVFDRFDEGGVRGGVALGDAQAGVVAQLGRQFGWVAQEGGDVVLLAETCCEGGRADSAFEKEEALSVYVDFSRVAGKRNRVVGTCSADDEDLHGREFEGVQVMDLAASAILILSSQWSSVQWEKLA